MATESENPKLIPTESSQLQVFNIDTEQSEKNVEKEKSTKPFQADRDNRISHTGQKELVAYTQPENEKVAQNKDLTPPLTLQQAASAEKEASCSVFYGAQSSWNEQNCQLIKFDSASSRMANDLTEKEIEDKTYSSKLTNQGKFTKGYSKFRSTDKESSKEKSISFTNPRQEEDTKVDESNMHLAHERKRCSFQGRSYEKNTQGQSTDPEEGINQSQQRESGPEMVLESAENRTEHENNTQVEDSTNVTAQFNVNQGDSNVQEKSVPEVEIYVCKAAALFISCTLCLFFSILDIEWHWGLCATLGVALSYPLALVIIDLCLTSPLLRELWIESGDHFKMFDALSFMFAMVLILLRLGQVLHFATFANISFFAVALCYLLSHNTKLSLILVRLFYTLQGLLITLKIDEYINLKWEVVFFPSWIYFACLIVSCSRSLFYSIKKVLSQNRNTNSSANHKFGIIWYSNYYGLSIVALIYLIGAVQALNSGTYVQLWRIIIYVAFGINLILSVYTIRNAWQLVDFISSYQLIHSHLAQEYLENLKPAQVISLQPERKASYFVKVSATYFKPLHNSFFAKGQENINRIKTMLSKLKPNYSLSYQPFKSETIQVNTLKQGKEELDQRLDNLKLVPNYTHKKLNGRTRSELPYKANKKKQRTFSISTNNTTDIKMKEFAFEENEKDELKMLRQTTNTDMSRTGEEENVCYLCYDNPADAILISCGHGGICYECASSLVKTKNECMQCRAKVEAIYRIDPNPKLDDIIKGVELCKVVVE